MYSNKESVINSQIRLVCLFILVENMAIKIKWLPTFMWLKVMITSDFSFYMLSDTLLLETDFSLSSLTRPISLYNVVSYVKCLDKNVRLVHH